MTERGRNQDDSQGSRIVTGCIGALFVVLAIAIIAVADRPTSPGALFAASIIALLGIDALISAVRATRSLLSRIGPLP
ncbi:MAG: hypothetical protein QG550_1473 [Pseudomonadota bacterium]|nr:hypothetical protein [Pseudomonadota bacterium]